MRTEYRNQVMRARINRRRALAGAGSAAAGLAAFSTIGCGGGDDPGVAGDKGSGLISPRTDTTRQAKQGGVLQAQQSAEIVSLDSLIAPNESTSATMTGYVYGRLIKFKSGIIQAATGEIESDLAESWEISGDKLQITFKLRPGVKLDSRAPTNGREVDSGDVLFTANKVKELSTFRGQLFYDASPLAPIASMSAPDRRTVVVKLQTPDSLIMALLANSRNLSIQPREADGGFDARTTARGWGPWRVKELRPSLGIEYERNPDYYQKGLPYFDGVASPFISEYATILSQFRAGNIWAGAPIRGEDILTTKRDLPSLLLHQGEFSRSSTRHKIGVLDSPLKDERVRQGIIRVLDKDLIIDTLQNVKGFRDAGIPIQTRWHSSMPAGWDGTWLDPQSKEFGPNGAVYQYDLAEAKKLFSAAGFADGFTIDVYWSTDRYGAAHIRHAETLVGELENGGIKVNRHPETSATYTSLITRGGAKFAGIGVQASSAQGDPQEYIRGHFHSQGSFGIDQPPFSPEPDVDKMIDDMRFEFDQEKLSAMMKEFQRLMAKRQRLFLEPGSVPGLSLTWPWVGNAGVYRGFDQFGVGTEVTPHLWYDQSKRA